jgi:hypothetical protein
MYLIKRKAYIAETEKSEWPAASQLVILKIVLGETGKKGILFSKNKAFYDTQLQIGTN